MEKPTHEKMSATSSRSSSRRTSGTNAREALPTPPPDPRLLTTNPSASSVTSDNVFQYPTTKTTEISSLPGAYQSLLNYAEREKEFYKNLNESITKDCPYHNESAKLESKKTSTTPKSPLCQCEKMREECELFISPLNHRFNASLSAALATYGAFDQLTRLYALWDRYLDVERQLRHRKERLHYVNLLNEKIHPLEKDSKQPDSEVEQSIALLDTILATGNNASLKRSQLKQQRERSKSFMVDDTSSRGGEARSPGFNNSPLLRRQSTYSDGKSKVSKWTKVKAAFKWERANVPAFNDGPRELSNGVGLTPLNNEVARYLRVPSMPCGGASSADSIETGTPGTVSSASSMDDIVNSERNTLRRDSSKSDSRSETNKFEDNLPTTIGGALSAKNSFEFDAQKLFRTDSNKSGSSPVNTPIKSSSNKSFRKSKVVSDFEVLHEEKVADNISTSTRRLRPPPSPLDLSLKQDLNDLEYFYSPHLLKSPMDKALRKLSSPGNSSVPSSPSRHSDFVLEFESEDISSGDFSEPSSPLRKNFKQKNDEINRRYQMLRAKLDNEFETKKREWEKIKANPNAARTLQLMGGIVKPEEHTPGTVQISNLSTKQLEENLTPDFKKKLRKWRVKKQTSQPVALLNSPIKDAKELLVETKPKIDWNLWKTGQLKLEGQGLKPLPDQKDLPEDFQKKLEQWKKIKRGGTGGFGDSVKSLSKHNENTKKSSDDDRGPEKEKRVEKHKTHEKDKLEKLAKLKAIVSDHPVKTKEIEVKTSVGVMKFEGISRKFTRKLYEWEKARGIGPESSTFALLHPGYCPIDVGRITRENNKNENSPTLSRSLSLDSVSPNVMLPTTISHQASSLSLNDVNELKSDLEGIGSFDQLTGNEYKKYEEPEAVMVEVEDDIIETASPLITTNTRVKRQTPVYKYEQVACNDVCNSKHIQSFESHTNLAPLLSALKRFDELLILIKNASPETAESENVRICQSTISLVRNIYPYYTENLSKANVLNAISDVQNELSRITELHKKSPLDEACCQEILAERNKEYKEEFEGLQESLNLLRQRIQGRINQYPAEILPQINITEDGNDDASANYEYTTSDSRSKDQLSTTLEATDELSASQVENDTETTTIATTYTPVQRSFSNATANGSFSKKKLRLRKMGSRQNSKTESSNSSDEDMHSILETPRRMKRKNYRLKQRSFDDDFRRNEDAGNKNEDFHYVLKMRPGHPIEQCENVSSNFKKETFTPNIHSSENENNGGLATENKGTSPTVPVNPNVFVKTKRKLFTTIESPTATGHGRIVIAHEVNSENTHGDTVSQNNEVIPTNIESGQLPGQIKNDVTASIGHERITTLQQKSYSHPDVRRSTACDFFVQRKFHSAESVQCKRIDFSVRQPLATDSFRMINKSCGTLALRDDSTYNSQKRMELRFRKNPNVHSLQHPKLKKIESKIAKSNSGASVESSPISSSLTPIYPQRQWERKSLTPTYESAKIDFSTALRKVPSAAPLPESSSLNKPCTPISERAQRIRKAKEDFLQDTMPRPKPSFKRRDEIVRTETWEQYRRSDQSLSSATTTGGEDANSNLLKSFSECTIRDGGVGVASCNSGIEETPTQSDAGTDMDVATGVYDSLPRSVTRSGKISSKLGFATLASKFRRVKVKGKSSNNSEDSALSALCRQTLFAEPIAGPQQMQQESVMKSQSTPQARANPSPSTVQAPHLNKSQSEQYVKKESYV